MIYEFITVSILLASCLNGPSDSVSDYKENDISVGHLPTFFLSGLQNTSLSDIFGKIKQDFIHFLKEDLLGREYIVTALKGLKLNHSLIFVNPSDQNITIEIEYPDHDSYSYLACLNDTLTFKLQPNQTEVLQFECDVAGTSVNASREMALYYVSFTPNITLTEQVLPLKLWGQHYVVLPSRNPDDNQIVLIQTAHNNTDVHILGYDYVTIPNRFLSIQRRIMGTLPVTIKSSKPVSVSQVLFSVNGIDSAMVNIVPVKYSVEKNTLQNSPVFEYGYLKNSGLKENLKVPLSQYTYNIGSYDTLPDTIYGCTMMYTNASESSYSRTNCGYWNDSKTDNPWPTMTPGDGVDNNDNGKVDEEDCFSDFKNAKSTSIYKTDCKDNSDPSQAFQTLFVIPTLQDTSPLCNLHCSITYDIDLSPSISYWSGNQWMVTTDNILKFDAGKSLLLKIESSIKISMINCYYLLNNDTYTRISNDFWIPSVDNLQTQYVAVLPIIPTFVSQLSAAGCLVGSVFDNTRFTFNGKDIISLGKSFTKQEIRQDELNANQTFIIASHIISVHCYVNHNGYYVINHLIPVSGNSFYIDKSSKNSSEEQLTVISTDSNTLLQVSSWNQSECNCSRNEYYLLIEKGGDIRSFPMEEEFDVFYIKSNKPVVVMIFYKNETIGSSSSYLFHLDYVPPTNLQSTDNLWFDQSFKRKYNSTSNQIPGDKIDNDQDGLIDEEYCGFLLGDTDLYDVDLDGSLNEDCKGCPEGQELEPVMTCRDCNIGTFRENSSSIDKCQACDKNMTTFYTRSVSPTDCFPICEEGMELDNKTKTCTPCPVGYYKEISANDTEKNVTERFWCVRCPENKTTYTSGTVFGYQCIEHCGLGMYLEGNVCRQCGVGFFKNTSSEMSDLKEELRWNCSQCPDGQTTNSTGADKCIAGCMCPCNMVHTPKNFTDEELTKNIEEIKKKLAVNKEQLSSNIRKKISVMDDRPSARAVGSVGVVILTVCFGLLIALDYVTLTRHVLGLLREIRDLFLRN